MINLIKSAVYAKLNGLFSGMVYYNFAPILIADGRHYIYDIIAAEDADNMCNEHIRVSIQIMVVYPETAKPRTTSIEPDNDIQTIRNNFKLQALTHTSEGRTVTSNSVLVELQSPAKYDPQTKQYIALIRFRADFLYKEN